MNVFVGRKRQKRFLKNYHLIKDKIVDREKWEDIKNYNGKYQVSDKGRVKSMLCILRFKKQQHISSSLNNGKTQ